MLDKFANMVNRDEVILTYVTGRDEQLVKRGLFILFRKLLTGYHHDTFIKRFYPLKELIGVSYYRFVRSANRSEKGV